MSMLLCLLQRYKAIHVLFSEFYSPFFDWLDPKSPSAHSIYEESWITSKEGQGGIVIAIKVKVTSMISSHQRLVSGENDIA